MKKIIDGKLYNTATAREIGLDAGGDGFAQTLSALVESMIDRELRG